MGVGSTLQIAAGFCFYVAIVSGERALLALIFFRDPAVRLAQPSPQLSF